MMDTSALALDPEQLLSVLQAHEVEFVIVGGFSLAAHGVVRATKDIDIMPAPNPANLERLAHALEHLEATIDLGDIDPEELGITIDASGLARGGNFCLLTVHGRLDVMQELSGVEDYAELRTSAVEASMPGVTGPLSFAGYDTLLAMKSTAGRPQDLLDIEELRNARRGS
jgi:Nucleotidyl transferase AbiEii toxin, Type IV TA system